MITQARQGHPKHKHQRLLTTRKHTRRLRQTLSPVLHALAQYLSTLVRPGTCGPRFGPVPGRKHKTCACGLQSTMCYGLSLSHRRQPQRGGGKRAVSKLLREPGTPLRRSACEREGPFAPSHSLFLLFLVFSRRKRKGRQVHLILHYVACPLIHRAERGIRVRDAPRLVGGQQHTGSCSSSVRARFPSLVARKKKPVKPESRHGLASVLARSHAPRSSWATVPLPLLLCILDCVLYCKSGRTI